MQHSHATNTFAHRMFTDQGVCTHKHFEAEVDDGDAENGPGTDGHPAFDEYTSDSHYIVIDACGFLVHTQERDFDLEAYCNEHMDDGHYE